MKLLPFLLAAACATSAPAIAAPKKAKSRKPAYPGIIQMQPPSGAPVVESGKLISSDIGGLDLRFLRSAFEAGLLQSYLGELAKTKGQTEHVRKLGATLAATQTEENEQLEKLAGRKNVAVPGDRAAVQSRLVGELETLDGLKFDKAVLDQFLAVNRLAVSAYEAGSNSQDPDIRSFVGQMLPVAKARLQLASKMAGAPSQASGVPKFRTTTPPMTR
jgi:predicted outer membrane protein